MAPPGRYSNWVTWRLMGFTKENWQSIHTVFSFTFVVLSIFHLFSINWKSFLSYLKAKSSQTKSKKRELILSSVFLVVFLAGTLFAVPPFSSVMNLGENLTASWEKAEEEPPVAHAELLTLAELADQLDDITVDEIVEKLQRHEIAYENTSTQTLKEIAENNGQTPIEVYDQIVKKLPSQMAGSGIGQKSFETICEELNVNMEEAIQLLNEQQIVIDKEQTLHEISEEYGISPKEISELISQ